MAYRIQVHIQNDDPVVLDVDELPKPGDQFVLGMNPQRRDGKEVNYIMREVNQIIIPWWRINFIQVLPSDQEEDVPTFIRE
ncbi:MAG: hypothetical protein GYB64_03465 [Chloroflexi bacterium]|nr:hypothetical protein [Chloroflexota bacterium]